MAHLNTPYSVDGMTLPSGYKDAIHVITDIHFCFWDRLKILLGWKVEIHSTTYCENLPGHVYSESMTDVYRIHKLSGKSGVYVGSEELRESK